MFKTIRSKYPNGVDISLYGAKHAFDFTLYTTYVTHEKRYVLAMSIYQNKDGKPLTSFELDTFYDELDAREAHVSCVKNYNNLRDIARYNLLRALGSGFKGKSK